MFFHSSLVFYNEDFHLSFLILVELLLDENCIWVFTFKSSFFEWKFLFEFFNSSPTFWMVRIFIWVFFILIVIAHFELWNFSFSFSHSSQGIKGWKYLFEFYHASQALAWRKFSLEISCSSRAYTEWKFLVEFVYSCRIF